jgi:hypothetical protein
MIACLRSSKTVSRPERKVRSGRAERRIFRDSIA